MVRGMFIADTDAEAERIARPAYRKWFDSLMWLWKENNSFPGIPLSQDYDEFDPRRLARGRQPRHGAAQVRGAGGALRPRTISCSSLRSARFTHAQEMRSLDLFRREVMPALQETRCSRELASTLWPRRAARASGHA